MTMRHEGATVGVVAAVWLATIPVGMATASDRPATKNVQRAHDKCYRYRYIEPDNEQAERWCKRAASSGDLSALTMLAEVYFERPTELDKAVALYKQAANAGHPHALFALGLLYLDGIGVERDRTTGWALIEQAAENGHPEALALLEQLE